MPLENSIPGNCCSALFKNLVRFQGAVGGEGGRGSSDFGTHPGEGVRRPGEAVSAFTPPLRPPTPQLLKKIKRCERKGTESVTEEKCAVLFSTSFALGPNKLHIQLQVN